jgi:hypothetical protein
MSNTQLHNLKLAALPAIAALLLGSTAANADAIEGFIKSNLSQFGASPVLKMERHNGQWRLKDALVSIPVSYRAQVNGPQRYLLSVDIQVQHMAKGDGSVLGLRRNIDGQDAAWGDVNLGLRRENLLPMEKLGKDVCASHASPGTKSSSTSIPLTMWVHWHNAAAGPYSVGTQDTPMYTNIPATIECAPNPVSPPGGVAQKQTDFKVKSIALNYGGAAPTKVNPTTVCKSAKLSVVLHTSKAGVVDVKLHKKVGAGPIQAKSMQLFSKFDGNAHFVASYVEYIKVSQPTLVQAMAEEFNSPLGQTTGWKDVTLHCENANGGYAGTPGTSTNPDNNNWPAQPKQPKRVFDGKGGLATTPGGSTNPDDTNFPRQPKRVFDGAKNLAPTSGGTVNPDSRNAPKPSKPVIAPATPKKPAQERHGHLWPTIQKVR